MMHNDLQKMSVAGPGLLEPAEVVWRGESTLELRVRTERDSHTRPAHPALPGDRIPEVGDRVLIAADSHGELWIIASISDSRTLSKPDASTVSESGGASAAVETGDNGPQIVVRDRSGALVFEYEPETRMTTLYTPQGDLDIDVPQGALSFRASKGIRIDSEETVEVEGVKGVGLRSGGADEGMETRVAVQPEGLGITAQTANVAAGVVHFDASQVISRTEKALAIYGTLEIKANQIRQRARRFMTAVEDLFHLSARRVEADAEEDLRLHSGTATIKAKGRVKIDGDSIHLG
jgi:hypothetical protein